MRTAMRSNDAASAAFTRDMQKYQFGTFDCLCLHCGAHFDATTEP